MGQGNGVCLETQVILNVSESKGRRSSREGSCALKRGGNCRPEIFGVTREDGTENLE